MSDLNEEKRQAISDIRALYSVMYNFEDELKDEMQEKVDRLENFISKLLDLYTNLKQIEQEHQKNNGELREEIKHLKEELFK